ncbi:MAG: ATP-binding cassette domain-containing protein [Microbispora sp.]|nr:ATP-binding cassette domain-containing protein [Microbispora sp.]
MTYAIEAHGLVKRYGDKVALAGVDFAAPPGTVLGVLGPNGAGKTTAVRILATLVSPDEGRAAVGGHDVVKAPAEVRKRNLPAVLRWWSSVNPVSHLADSVRALLTGAPVGVHVRVTLAWAAAVTACFVPLAVRAYVRRIR